MAQNEWVRIELLRTLHGQQDDDQFVHNPMGTERHEDLSSGHQKSTASMGR